MIEDDRSRQPPSTQEWRDIARVPDVFFHILSWPEKKGGWTAEEFYAVGRSDWNDFLSHWRHYDPELGGTCVEIGCGAGRLTSALAGDFDRVVALDVSSDMIDRARSMVPENVVFHQVQGTTIPVGDGDARAVFSVITLQHLESFDDVRSYIREAHRVLRPGGSAMLHITLASRRRPLLQRIRVELGIRRSRRGLRRGKVHAYVRWREYEWEEVWRALGDVGFEQIELRMFPVRSNGWQHQFWLVRRSAG